MRAERTTVPLLPFLSVITDSIWGGGRISNEEHTHTKLFVKKNYEKNENGGVRELSMCTSRIII